MSIIRRLSETTINRIAAGEVVERPSSVVKELVENALDANADKIEIILEQGGKNLITIIDNGHGISKEDLSVAIERHTTSKLFEDDIMNITSFGFRGEALPSIASISRMEIVSRKKDSDSAYSIYVEGGEISPTKQASLNHGTRVTIRDLFFATPARLKFLKSDKSELATCIDIVKKIAFAHPSCEFTITHNDKTLLKLQRADNLKKRITDIIGDDFMRNSMDLAASREEIEITGYASLPTFNKATNEDQYLFINNRPVKDKLLNVALRIAYQDVLSRDRFPAAVIFINTSPYFVDVNVHPAKTEVRFRDANLMRGMLISTIKDAIFSLGKNVSDTIGMSTYKAFVPASMAEENNSFEHKKPDYFQAKQYKPSYNIPTPLFYTQPEVKPFEEVKPQNTSELFPLGGACAQVHETYIISQTPDSIIIIDQHAAHERLTYEKLKRDMTKHQMQTQRLLIPEIVEIADERRALLLQEKSKELAELGLAFDIFSMKSVVVTEVPQIIANADINKLINDIADNLLELGEESSISAITEHVLETYACHHSIRAGRKLSIIEMNHLLREMESTEFSGQCNHGRPTYITLKLKDIEKLFGRS